MRSITVSLALVLAALGGSAIAQQAKPLPKPKVQIGPASILDTRKFPAETRIDWTQSRTIPENPELFDFKGGGSALSSLSTGPSLGVQRVRGGAYWPAIGWTGWYPPDPTLAVGPNHVVVTVNAQIAFFSKAGVQQFSQGAQTFFSGLGAGSFQFDPRVIYDRLSGRWIIIFDEEDGNAQVSKILLAVSDDSDPNGVWYRYRINANTSIPTHWLDYPGLGVNNTGIVVCGNMFPFGSGNFGGVQYIWVDKAPLLSGGAAGVTYFLDSNSGSVQLADIADPSVGVMYGLEDWGPTALRIHAVSPNGSTLAHSTALIGVPSFSSPAVAAPSSPGFLDPLDGRLFQVAWANGKLVATHTINGAGNVNRVRWYEIALNNYPSASATLVQSGEAVPSGGPHFIQGGIAENSVGDIGFIFTRSASTGPGLPADAMAAGHKNTDPLGSTSAPTLLQTSAGTTYGGTGTNRWGDYFRATVDPTDDLTFWGVAMTGDSSGHWRTTVHSWMISQLAAVAPSAFSIFRGQLVSGGLADLASSDDSRLVVQTGLVLNAQESPIAIDVTGVSPSATASALSLTVEGQASSTGIGRAVEFWDWVAGQWVLVDDRTSSFGVDTVVTVAGTNVNRFIQAGTLAVKARIRARITGIATTTNYQLKLDQVVWKIVY